jgi:hypothetical protein
MRSTGLRLTPSTPVMSSAFNARPPQFWCRARARRSWSRLFRLTPEACASFVFAHPG